MKWTADFPVRQKDREEKAAVPSLSLKQHEMNPRVASASTKLNGNLLSTTVK